MKKGFTGDLKKTRKNIGIIIGGSPEEIEYAEISAREVKQALSGAGYNSAIIKFDSEIKENLTKSVIAAAFIIDASFIGEENKDGDLRDILEEQKIPYTASKREAAETAKNKVKSKQVFIKAGLKTPKYLEINERRGYGGVEKFVETNLSAPYIVKPRDEGSSVGVVYVAHSEELKKQVNVLLEQFKNVLIEEYISGIELTVPIIEIEGEIIPLDVIEIEKNSEIYSYRVKLMDLHEDKRRRKYVRFHYPARIDKRLFNRVQETAINAHKSINCRGYSRVDMIVSDKKDIYLIEINALPVISRDDFHALAAARKGITYEKLVEIVLDSAF